MKATHKSYIFLPNTAYFQQVEEYCIQWKLVVSKTNGLIILFKEYLKLLNRLYDITCSTISNICYNLLFTTKFNDSSILIRLFHVTIWICRWRMNTLVTPQYQPRFISSITKIFSRWISQSDWNIQIKLNYFEVTKHYTQYSSYPEQIKLKATTNGPNVTLSYPKKRHTTI